jgi:hypothetical protein
MNAREMHYDFITKLNKIDSQKYKNLLVPEIDWKLNEAQDIFVKMIAQPKVKNGLGFEANQRVISDIASLVINQTKPQGNCLQTTKYDDTSYLVSLPNDYWYYISAKVIADKGECKDVELNPYRQQQGDLFEVSVFDKSSFEWREVNITFLQDKIRIYTDGTFVPNYLCLNYLKVPQTIHNAQDAQGGTYTTLSGTVLTGSKDCELPEKTHREIVDIAVLIATGELQMSDYQIKENKLKFNN